MSTNKRVGSNPPSHVDRSKAPGLHFDNTLYVGIVKSAVDSTRTGRLQVYIPELGGDNPDDPKFWRTLSYASPFGGVTKNPLAPQLNAYGYTNNTYGFWMVPPDIGNQVLCLFAGGDPNRGFWFACVNTDLSQTMKPAVGSSEFWDPYNVPPALQPVVKPGNRYPVAEFNTNNPAAYNDTFFNNYKPLHLPQFINLLRQGLQDDPIRGTIGSSAQRETPSAVFGFSTPGRAYGKDPGDDPDLLKRIQSNNVELGELLVTVRKGGHTLVMDDGDIKGQDQLVRLRTAGGHQILLHDSEQTIYISSANGMTWMELTKEGQILMYSKSGFALRTEGSINLHADKNILMNAGGSIRMKADKGSFAVSAQSAAIDGNMGVSLSGMNISAKATIGFSASGATASISAVGLLTCKATGKAVYAGGAMTTVSGAVVNLLGGVGGGVAGGALGVGSYALGQLRGTKMQESSFADTKFDTNRGWTVQPGAFKSIVSTAPTHEPYDRYSRPDPIELVDVDASGNPVTSETTGGGTAGSGPSDAKGTGTGKTASEATLAKQAMPPGRIGNLDQDTLRAYNAQLGYTESGNRYDIRGGSSNNYLGMYQFGAAALETQGYLKPGSSAAYGTNAVNNPDNWTGKDGINSAQDFMSNGSVQEVAQYNLTKANYNALTKSGVITNETSEADAAGYLMSAHLLGAGNVTKWYYGKSGTTSDAFGTNIATYYNNGRYSATVLAGKSSSTTASTG